jgi:hypothetical protein
MYQRIVAAVAMALFTLLAVVSGVVTDLQDRSYPLALGASSTLALDFAPSGLSDDEAFDELARLSDDHDLGLVRILPDLAGDADGQVFVPLGEDPHALPARVRWYGDQPTGVVAGPEAVAHSFATGQYLVTGSRERLDEAVATLASQSVKVRRVDDTLAQSASFLVRQESFRTTVLAGVALMVAMALFWLSVRAQARALRVLGGVSGGRIQLEDLGRLALAVALPAVPVTALAAAVVRVRHGDLWLGTYVTTLVGLEVAVVAVTLGCAMLMSVVSWPSAGMLAARQPAVRALRSSSGALKAVTFVLVVVTAGPAWWAFHEAQDSAAQEARWRALSDQVALRFPGGLGEEGFVEITTSVGAVVADADRAGEVALSYAMEPDQLAVADTTYDSVVLVNDTWLRLMGVDDADLVPVDRSEVPDAVRAGLAPNLALWERNPEGATSTWERAELMTTREDPVPLAAAGSGDLAFPDRPLLVVVPAAADAFNDDFLASLSSSNNLVFAGLEATTARLHDHGLATTVQIKYAAEDGVLRAQFAAYEAWLRGIALVALLGAFVLAVAISATITALLHARRDFPLRLDGRGWAAILRQRVGREWGLGLALGGVVALAQSPEALPPTAAVVALALGGTALAHVAAARWTFEQLRRRSI